MMLIDRSILIAEDNTVLRSVLEEIFREYGWRVRAAEVGFAALQALAEELPAVVLSDLEMGGMSGFEFLSIVRRRSSSIRVVSMSGAFSGTDVPAGVAVDAFYAKGGRVSALLDLVAEIGRKPIHMLNRGDIPVWLPSGLDKLAPHGAPAVACRNCMRAVFISGPYTGQVSHLVCPYCRHQATVFLLRDSSDVTSNEPRSHASCSVNSSIVGSHTSESGGARW